MSEKLLFQHEREAFIYILFLSHEYASLLEPEAQGACPCARNELRNDVIHERKC